MDDLKRHIRSVPDFPKEGILFYDISTLMKDAAAFRRAVDRMTWSWVDVEIDKVVGMESRGFIFAPILASRLNAGFVMVRKPGKLPAKTLVKAYGLEYGEDSLEMHEDAVEKGERVLIVDDLLATGGTARATVKLVEEAGGRVQGLGFLIELVDLKGRERLSDHRIEALISY
jgi:adenine phosphoribosyltransferase